MNLQKWFNKKKQKMSVQEIFSALGMFVYVSYTSEEWMNFLINNLAYSTKRSCFYFWH